MVKMTHTELCRLTAERFVKDSGNNIALYEYQSFVSGEHPDVLVYGHSTILFEIKMSRADFLSDKHKDARVKYKTRSYIHRDNYTGRYEIKYHRPIARWNEKPHLGLKRYYVCESGVIQPGEVERWGLYWFRGGKFFKKKESEIFVRNIHAENRLLSHAFRKYASSIEYVNIIIKPYR